MERSEEIATRPLSNRIGRHMAVRRGRAKVRRNMRCSTGGTGGNSRCSSKVVACVVVVFSIAFTCAYAQWDPYNSVKIGDASTPGPTHGPQQGSDVDTGQNMHITTRNVHGIMSNLMATLRSGTDIICVQEADVAEANVADLTEQALAAGYTAIWGEPLLCPRTVFSARTQNSNILQRQLKGP